MWGNFHIRIITNSLALLCRSPITTATKCATTARSSIFQTVAPSAYIALPSFLVKFRSGLPLSQIVPTVPNPPLQSVLRSSFGRIIQDEDDPCSQPDTVQRLDDDPATCAVDFFSSGPRG